MRLHPGYEQRPNDPNFIDCVKTPLTEEEATYYLKTAWKKIYGIYPSINSLALLWAQSCGETGRWKLLRCNNWGNIKRRKNDHTLKWTSYDAGEVLADGKHHMFYPYHPQTHFAAWENPLDGAEYYIRFLSGRKRYKKAWIEVMIGDPITYCAELKKAGYFTADLQHYTKGVVSLTNEFKRKAERLMAWEPPQLPINEPTKPPTEPVIESDPIPSEHVVDVVKPDSRPITEVPFKEESKKNFWQVIINFLKKLFNGR